MEFSGPAAYPLLILVGLGVALLLVVLFALKSMLKMTKSCLVLGALGIFALFAAALAVLWALAR